MGNLLMSESVVLAPGLFVSGETFAKLKTFESLIKKWQPKLNLVSSRDIGSLWERHILDSVQLLLHLPPPPMKLIDMGSGAGFPGIVLGVLGYSVTLVESDARKAIFLKEASRVLEIKVEIVNARLESMLLRQYDIVTARGLAELAKLLGFSERFVSYETILCFMKGKSWWNEEKEAKESWDFQIQPIRSITSNEARILIIQGLKRKTGAEATHE